MMTSPCRSPRIEGGIAKRDYQQSTPIEQLLSPSPSQSVAGASGPSRKRKRKSAGDVGSDQGDEPESKRQPKQELVQSSASTSNPVAFWVEHTHWPRLEEHEYLEMAAPAPRASRGSSSKRSSSHHSTRQRQLLEHDVHFATFLCVHPSTRELIESLKQGNRRPSILPGYPANKVMEALYRAQVRNEPRVQRDVMPWILPSPEHLFLCDELTDDYIGEELSEPWYRCETMGSSVPKPDVTIGLQRSAFTQDEWARLENCATSSASFMVMPNLWFPFLICEAKTGRSGLEGADTQNVHSGSIALRSILRVYIAAYGRDHEKVRSLLGRILVFTVSHNCQSATIYGHCAIAKPGTTAAAEEFEYHRCEIGTRSLVSYEDEDRYWVYNFVRNLYDRFAPEHVSRLREAIAALPEPEPRTGNSFAASTLNLDDESPSDAGDANTQGSGFKKPGEPASSLLLRETRDLRVQLAEQTKDYMKQIDDMRRDAKEREMRLERENKERENRLLGSIEQQKAQIDKLLETISALTKANGSN